ncbi:MAG TPA: hypothetical protein VF612_09330 [Jatrophihabitans sp.]|jgi:hypothetical protein|uniref:hypothetical protein n=1 Tax=Jatrophihabitans sp. TaxID=1932789 RepID=UPI002F11840C
MTHAIEYFALLITLSLAYSTSLRRVERLRRAVSLDRVPDMTGVWTFAGAVVLPLPLVAALVMVAALGEWPSRKVHQDGRPVKYAVSVAGLAGAYLAAAIVVDHVPGPSGAALAVPTVCLLNVGYVAALYYVSGGRSGLRMFLDPRLHLIEVSTQGVGAGVGLAMLYWHPLLAVGALVLLYGLHLASLRHVVEVTESFDPTTRLWSETAWMVQAQQKLHDVHGHVALLMIDPDEAGQELRILQSIESGLAPTDLLGRYGTRQIVVLIPVGRRAAGPFLSTGFRADLAAAGVHAALGCATTADSELEALLIEAMSDLMGRRAAAGVHRNW